MSHIERHITLCWLMLCLSIAGLCGCASDNAEVEDAANAVYYWRQELRLTDAERDWLRRHEVRKMYVHLFDVERRPDGSLRPRMTLDVTDAVPAGIKVIPVVFLTPDMMRDTTGLSALPTLIARRVQDMMTQNDLGPLDELQLDFDWARSNQQRYFGLLTAMRQSLSEVTGHDVRLSATIRLHQLQMQAPPVDYGALMVYNVGRLQQYDEDCSILRRSLVEPYLRNLRGYKLPLCAALPVYDWDLLFHGQEFCRIVRGIDVTDTTDFVRIDTLPGQRYMARRYMPIPVTGVSMRGDGRIYPGDMIRHEAVSADELQAVLQALAKERPAMCRQVILYHLDEKQLKKYSDEDIQRIYVGR